MQNQILFLQKQQEEDQRLISEQAEKNKSETAEAAATHAPSATSETSSSDAARLDAVEQRMEKFSEEQNNLKEQLLSHGEMLKLILQKLP